MDRRQHYVVVERRHAVAAVLRLLREIEEGRVEWRVQEGRSDRGDKGAGTVRATDHRRSPPMARPHVACVACARAERAWRGWSAVRVRAVSV
jgi:hypothetical protein